MIRPPALAKGNTIGILAPGKKLSADAVHSAALLIESWGYRVRLSKNLLSDKHSYLSGSDEERYTDLQEFLNDDSVNAIICARGGYGSTRFIDRLDFTAFLKNPKWICGFSDITALHLKLQALNIQSIHSTMPVLFGNPESKSSVESLQKILRGESTTLTAIPHQSNRHGNVKGEVIGGNLSLIADSLGTLSEIETAGKILVMEEVDEYLYRIDRMLVQLNRADKLKRLAGLVVGHMTDIKDTELPFGETVESIILNQVKDYSYPVAFGFPAGHQNPNIAWAEGSTGSLNINTVKSELSF